MQFQTQSDFLSLFYFILWTKLGINITKIEEFEQKFIKSTIIILFHQLIFRNFLGYLQLFTNTCQKHVIECNFAVYSTLYSTYMQVGVTYSDKWPWYVG